MHGYKSFRTPLCSLALGLLLVGGLSPHAVALDVSVLGAMTVSNASLGSTSIYDSGGTAGVNLGGGATIGINLFPFFAFETGALYLKHSLSSVSNYTSQDLTLDYVTLPAVVRFSPISLIAVNGGVYYGVAQGNTLETTTPPSPKVISQPSRANEWGLLGGVGVRWPVLPPVKLRLDLLYQWGLTDLKILAENQKSRNFDVLAGVMIDFW